MDNIYPGVNFPTLYPSLNQNIRPQVHPSVIVLRIDDDLLSVNCFRHTYS